MSIQLKPTAAEEALIAALTGSDRGKAAARMLGERGLPTRRIEAWHYTDLRKLLNNFPPASMAIQSEFTGEEIGDMPELVDGFTTGFSNAFHVEGMLDDLPQGVTGAVAPSQAVDHGDTGIEDNTIGVLNAGLAECGAALEVAKGAQVETPVILAHATSGGTASALAHRVTLGEGALATFIERHHSTSVANHQNVVCDLTLAKGARAVWAIVQELGAATDRLAQLNVDLAEDAELTVLFLNAGGRLVRQEIHAAVNGENANLDIKGVNLIGAGAHVDVTTTLTHSVPHTTARELVRNVVTEKGTGAFQGQIRVGQPAQKTDAQMACNTLLLSDDADFSAKPELEIFADDVVCAHGATVSDIENEHLFYLRARGIGEREARALLIKAFVEEVFEEIGNEALENALIGRIEDWLDGNG